MNDNLTITTQTGESVECETDGHLSIIGFCGKATIEYYTDRGNSVVLGGYENAAQALDLFVKLSATAGTKKVENFIMPEDIK